MQNATEIKNSFVDLVSSSLKNWSKRKFDDFVKRKIEYINEITPILRRVENVEENFPLFVKRNISFMNRVNHVSEENIDEIFLTFLSFLGEYTVYQKLKNREADYRLSAIWKRFEKDTEFQYYSIAIDYMSYANYIRDELQFDVLTSYIGGRDFQAFLNYEKNVKNAEKELKKIEDRIQDWNNKVETELNGRDEKVSYLKEALEKYEQAFNFVGLSQGFEKMLSQKEMAKWLTFIVLVVMFVATLTPLGFSFWKFIQGEELSWQKMLPVIGLEFVLIYFFRVVLNHYNSIQTQIMQLELRQSLCQFIQNYAEYAKEMKANDGVSLEKFENLIFSSILSNPDKVPGTFDGIESVTALIKELRSK